MLLNHLPDRQRRAAVSVVLALCLTLLSATPMLAAPNPQEDAPATAAQPAQGFYSEASGYGAGFGYTIANVPGGPQFYTVFRELGGPAVLGYPVSAPFEDTSSGDMYLPLQRALLHWHSGAGEVSLANVLELIDAVGLELWLYHRGIPAAIEDDGGSTFAESRAIRLSWMTDQGIYERFLQNALVPGNIEFSIFLYGLPMSRPERLGPFVVQRFQRAAFQRWVEEVPGLPVPGTVTQVFAGDLFKEAGLIPPEALRPQPDPATALTDETLGEIKQLLAGQPATAHLVPYLEGAIIGYAPDVLDTAALYVGDWVLIYLHPVLQEGNVEAIAAALAHIATYLEARALAPTPLERSRETCKRLVAGGLRVEAAFWEALWGPGGRWNDLGYGEVLNGYVHEAQQSAGWADFLADIHCA